MLSGSTYGVHYRLMNSIYTFNKILKVYLVLLCKIKLILEKLMSKVENINDNIDIFGLSYAQTRLLFSLQYKLVQDDVKKEENSEIKKEKRLWCDNWSKKMDTFLIESSKQEQLNIVMTTEKLNILSKKEVNKVLNNKTPLFLILLETVLFIPYYQLGDKSSEKKIKINKKVKKDSLCQIASILTINTSYIDTFESSYVKAKDHLTGFWTKVLVSGLIGTVLIALTAGFAAPFIASAFAGAGLSGAAAISAGLAVLGGGAIAAGGLGMAGGIAVVVGGGAILGGVGGGVAGALLTSSPDFALTQAAKLEVVMKEVILGSQKDILMAQHILNRQQEAIQVLEKSLQNFKLKEDENKEKIKNLTLSISHLRKALKHNMEFIKLEQK